MKTEHIEKKLITVEAITPLTPNFIKTPIGSVPIHELSDKALRAIGKAWTAELIAKAKKRREAINN